MDRGDYRLATMASTHGLAAYPSCLAAHRILGEAHLELGNTAPATKHFEHTLAVDPLNVVARLGLGVASEEQKDYGAAYAHYLHAWEINPALDQVRDELVRLRGLLGVEDRLHPTRAGLAGIHARGGQLHRAANEWRAVLAIEPESRRARTSFAELLWRQGEDGLAAVACRDALRGSPENARALAIMADTERRRGGANADEFAERYRAVDPTGDVLKLLSEWRADVDLGFLATDSALVDDFDFSAHAVPADQLGTLTKVSTNALAGNQIAAPDLWDTLVKDLSSELPPTGIAPTVASGVEPFTWNDAGPDQPAADPFADLGIQPFDANDLGGASDPAHFSFAEPAEPVLDVSTADIYAAALSKAPASAGQPETFARASSIDEDNELAALGIEPFSFDGMPHLLPDVDDPASFAPRREPATTPPVFVDPFVGADGKIDLTAGWDDLDKSLAAATPTFETAARYDDLSAQIDMDGIVPFDADIPGEDEDAWAPLTEDDFGIAPVAAVEVVQAPPRMDVSAVAISEHVPPLASDWSMDDVAMALEQPSALDALMALPTMGDLAAQVAPRAETHAEREVAAQASGVDELIGSELIAIPVTFDDEVIFGIPAQQSSGYTELLRRVDVEGLDGGGPVHAEADPVGSPDSNGAPLAFEDLLAVTSRDGTAPLVARDAEAADPVGSPFDFADTDTSAAVPAELGVEPSADPFDGITAGIYTGILDDEGVSEPLAERSLEPFSFGASDTITAGVAAESIVSDLELTPFDFEAALAEVGPVETDSSQAESLAATFAAEPEAPDDGPMPDWSGSGGLGMSIASVVWPAFVNQTSDLIDRDLGNGSVFTRLRAGKSALVAAGRLVVDRRLVDPAVTPASVEAPVEPAVAGVAQGSAPVAEPGERRRQRPEMSEQTRLDLMAMRVRLIEDPDSYEEVAATVEQAIGEGLTDALALRILGEAYLKLGKMEQAAAQFRQAMLARQRTR